MLKKLTLVFLFCCSLLSSRASHIEGGELRYEFNGTNYTVYLKVFAECGTANFLPTSDVTFYSTVCGDSFMRQIPLVEIDTITNMWCPGTTITCGGAFNSMRVAIYSDTVSLQACTDWKMKTVHTALMNSLDNILNPGTQSLVLEATLNNSTSINRSAYIANDPPFYAMINSWTTVPFQAVDADGDAVTYTLENLSHVGGGTISWDNGYTNINQLGNFTMFFGTNLVMFANLMSENIMCCRVRDIRNGVEVGSYQRVWTTRSRPGTNPSVPLPATGTTFTYTTCPGQSNSITLTFEDSVNTDSVFVDFLPYGYSDPNLSSTIFNMSTSSAPGTGSSTLTWTTLVTLDPNVTPYFYIPVLVRDNHCPNSGYAYYSVIVHVLQCNPDSVWAGDANADYTADMYDPLAIAVAYGTTGTIRPGATTTWQAEYCPNWSTQFTSGINHKHADCNGDGTINSTDLAAVTANYGQVHLKPGIAAKSTAFPDLYFDLAGIVFAPGATVSVPIKLGTGALPMNYFYGLATNIELDGITLGTAPTLDYTGSWVGNTSNTLEFLNNASNNNFDWVYARKNQVSVSGDGTIATMTFTIPTGLADGTPIEFYFNGTRIINQDGMDIDFNSVDDTAYITATNVPATNTPSTFAVVVPNPSKNAAGIQVTTLANEAATIVVTDIAGRVIHKEQTNLVKGQQSITLPTVAPGMYEVRIQSQSFTGSKAIKWIQL